MDSDESSPTLDEVVEKKPVLRGLILAFASECLATTSNVIVKGCRYFKGSDQCIFRYATQLVVMIAFNAWHNAQNRKRSKKPTSLKGNYLFLAARALFGTVGLLSVLFAIKLINPSDAIAIVQTSIVIVLVLSRIFLGERHTVVHLFSICMSIAGVLFISKPEFLFGNANTPLHNSYKSTFNSSQNGQILFTDKNQQFIGTALALLGSIFASMVYITVKKLCNNNIHSSIMMIYTSGFGLPTSLMLSAIFYYIDFKNDVPIFVYDTAELLTQIGLSFVAAILEVGSQYCTTLALKYENVSKVTLVKSSSIGLSFLLQYVMLGIVSGIFNTIGACLIFLSVLIVLVHKILDEKYNQNQAINSDSCKSAGETLIHKTEIKKSNLLQKIVFYKF
jgi:drug/metabolite transporter (DMT)-like permease